MDVRDLMCTEVRTCRPEDTLSRVAEIMWEADCGCVPVTDEAGRIVGMVTDRDVCMAAYTRGRPLHELSLYWTMSQSVHACHPEDEAEAVEALMRRHHVRRLPVIDADAKLVGLVSLSDLAQAAQGHRTKKAREQAAIEVAHTLAVVSRPRCLPVESAPTPAPARSGSKVEARPKAARKTTRKATGKGAGEAGAAG